jgi:molybdopterin-containing oxidoreductase family membrane subunit
MNAIAQPRPAGAPSSLVGLVLVVAAAVLVAAGGYLASQLASAGHAAFGSDSRGISWGLPIVTYDFFLLSSTGLTMLASAWTVFGWQPFEPVARRAQWLAVAALIGGVAALFAELGAPLRAMLLIPISFQTAAPMFWKVWGVIVYTVALVVLVTTWLASSVSGSRPSRTVATVAFAAALFITFVAGTVYGMMAMRPFWFGGEVSLAFIVEALLGAVTFVIIFTHVAHGLDASTFDDRTRALFRGPMASLFAALMIAHALFVVSRLVAGLWSNADGMQVWDHLWSRPAFQAQLWVGVGVPLLITLLPGLRSSLSLQLVAAVIAVVALFAARYDFVIGGQLVPLFKGSWVHGLLQYTPTMADWAVLVGAIALANLVNAFGERRFSLGSPKG